MRRLRFALLMGGVGALIALVVAGRVTIGSTDLPVIGQGNNLATVLLYALPIVSGLIMALSFRRLLETDESLSPAERMVAAKRGRQWATRIVASLVVAGLVFGGTALIFFLLTNLFTGLVVSRAAAILLTVGLGALAGFLTAYWAVAVTSTQLLVVGLLFTFVMLGLAMANATNPQWWENSISYLSHDSGGDIFFRLGLILGGLIVMSVAVDIIGLFRLAMEAGQISKRNFRIVQFGLLAASFGIVGVGLFPTVVSDLSDFLHNLFANGMIGLVMIGMFAIPILVPVLPPSFRIFSFTCGVIAVGLFLSWAVMGWIIFSIFEVLILSLAAVWVIGFMRFTLIFVRRDDGLVA
jgi:hypothetical protein